MSRVALSTIDSSYVDSLSSSKSEPSWLAEYRKNSLAVYQDLPTETSPLYNKYTDAKRMDLQQISTDTSSDPLIPDFLNRRLTELEKENHIIQIGTNIHRININDDLSSKGVIVSSLDDALQDHPDLIKKALETTNSKDDKFTALNNAAFNSGIFVYIPRNVQFEAPIHLLSCLSVDGTSTISRNVLVAEENSKSTLVQELYSPKTTKQQAYLEMLNTLISADAQVDGTTLQMMDQSSINFSTRKIDVAKDGKSNWYLGLFGTLLSRYRIDYYLNENGATINDSEVVFGNNEQSFDLQTNVNHQSQYTDGRVIQKSILRNKSKSLFKGMIRINENASKSNSYLSGRSILLDADAKSDAIPGLEIFTNDVKATHSASVAQIDEEQIFYLGTRCLSKSEAERVIIEGFLEPLSRKMSIQIRAWIAYLIESKWEGHQLSINIDEELKKFTEIEATRYNENSEIEQHYKYR